MINYQKTINRIQLKNFPADIKLSRTGEGHEQFIIVTLKNTTCASSGKQIDVDFRFPAKPTENRQEALDYVKKCIIWVLMHELDECFYYRGKQHYDPHEGVGQQFNASLLGRV